MKTTYNVCAARYDPEIGGIAERVIKSFRHRQDAEAFMANKKNVRQYGDMQLVEHFNRHDADQGVEVPS